MTTSARLRKSFRYPSESDSDSDSDHDARSALDEQEQDLVLARLRAADRATNALYVKGFTLLPVGVIPSFVYYLLSPSSRGGVRLLSLLAVTSLLATAFVMWFVPCSDLDGAGGEDGDDGGVTRHLARRRVRKLPFSDVEIDDDGPLGRTLPYLNLGICLLLAGAGLGLRGRRDVPGGFGGFLFLPAVVLGVVTLVRRSMRDVEEGIGELGKLRYGYKGA